jgi:hypothetical protein
MNVLRSSMGSSFRRQYSSVSCDGVAVVTAAVEEGDPASFDKVDPDRTSPTTTTTTAATTLSSTSSHSGAKAILHGETNRRVPIARRNSMSCTGVGLFRRQSSQASIQEYKTNYSEEFTKDSGEEGCHVSPDRRQRMTRRSSARGGLFRRQSSQASIQYNHSVDDVAHDSATPPTPPQQLIDQRPRLSRRSSSRLFRRQSSQASIQYQPSEELAMGYEPAHPTSTNQASSTRQSTQQLQWTAVSTTRFVRAACASSRFHF